MRSPPPAWALAAGLLVATAALYAGVRGQAYVVVDDLTYYARNARVLEGLGGANVRWAFGTFYLGNWHPLTWLSYLADAELFGLDAGAQKLENVALHAANAALLFALLRAATGSTWRSLLAAALFALHPLRVESVAWVSERKDVLAGALWWTTALAWVAWTRRPSWWRYALAALAFALGLMAKAMLVTLPAALLLVDAWPLGRIGPGGIVARVAEKWALWLLAAAGAWIAFQAQAAGGAVNDLVVFGPAARLGGAALGAAAYLGKLVWPVGLAAAYPHPALAPGGLVAWKVGLALAVLVGLGALGWWQRARRPWLAFGYAWFLVTLLPVAGLIQVGLQGMADRYTYVPLVGPAVAIAWSAGELAARSQAWRRGVVAAAVGCLLVLATLTVRQVSTWEDSFTVYGHALRVTDDNYLALKALGAAHGEARRPEAALPLLEQAVALMPSDAHAWMNLGLCQAMLGKPGEGLASLRRAAALRPGDDAIWFNLGLTAALSGAPKEAQAALQRLRALRSPLAETLEPALSSP
ncbi:MAG: tetratricopeptide repeat protein [Anaeromyxobacteraceae bacterium]